jgi:two-component system, LytTR family, response regulator
MNRLWKAVIVDDERLARVKLRTMLEIYSHITVIGEADNSEDALRLINKAQPDVVFLDIQMPGESGFDLVNRLEHPVNIIFVTAFDEYAIRAFEINALDYLLKPVTPDRLNRAIERLIHSAAPVENPNRRLEHDDFLFLTIGRNSRFLRVREIKYISAADVYSEIVTVDDQKALVLKPLSEWEERLPENYFARIHRSAIINIEFVERVEKLFNHSYQVYLRGENAPLTMSRRYAARLKEKLS